MLPVLLAAAVWSAPVAMERSHNDHASRPRLAITAAGVSSTAWTRFAGGHASVVVDGREFRRSDWPAGPVPYSRRGTVIAFTDERQRTLTATGGLRARGRRIASASVGGGAGRTAVAWFDDRGTSNDEVVVALRFPDHRFRTPVRLAREKVRSVSVAVGPRGDVLVAWDAFGKVRARYRSPTGRHFGPTQTIRSEEAFNARLQTEILANGRAVVAWTAKFRSEGGDSRHTFVQTAIQPAGRRRFLAAELLHRSAGAPEIPPRLDGGRVAWTQPDGVYLEGQRVAPAGAALEDLAGDAVVWSQAGRIFADGQELGPGADADAVVNPGTGQPVVVWAQEGRIVISSRG
jgi:hypothetical protein